MKKITGLLLFAAMLCGVSALPERPAAFAGTGISRRAPLSPMFLNWWKENKSNGPLRLSSSTGEKKPFYGHIPSPFDCSHLLANPPREMENTQRGPLLSQSSELPVSFDLRTYNRVTSVKDQGDYGTCSTHAAIGSLESNYIGQFGEPVDLDLSELHLAWFIYRDPTPGRAFFLSQGNDPFSEGANQSQSVAFLSRLAGPTLESNLSYDQIKNVRTVVGSKPPEAYKRYLTLRDAYTIGIINASNRDRVKGLIKEHGAVAIGYYAPSDKEESNKFYGGSGDSFCYYKPGDDTHN
nr:hypothetical protein [Fretibacterium sp.]